MFYNCKSLKDITIAGSVTSIGYQAFYGCLKLNQTTFNDLAGWRCTANKEATDGEIIEISASALSANAGKTASDYLKNTYCNYYWEKVVK